jgi:TolB protein
MTRLGLFIAAIASTLMLAGVAAAAGPAPVAPEVGSIAFTVYDHSRSIYVASGDGSGVRRLVSNAGPFYSWSPDGEQLVFSREHDGRSDLYAVGAGGGPQRRLTDSASNSNPAWSPDGELIAFDRCRTVAKGPCAIFTIKPDGRALHRISAWGLNDDGPVWAPNGEHIAFASLLPQGIYVMAADGRDVRRLTRQNDNAPIWSPDSEQIAFTRATSLGHGESGRTDIYVIQPDGAGLRRLTLTGAQNFDPSWSPDSMLIAFVESPSAEPAPCPVANAVYVMAADGGQQRQLTAFGNYESPEWSPSEEHIAFVGDSGEPCTALEPTRSLDVISPDASNQLQVSQLSPEAAGQIAWQPQIGA